VDWSGGGGADTIAISLRGGAAAGWVYFFFNSPDILLTAHIHDFSREQGGGAEALGW